MAKINEGCTLNVKEHSPRVIEISAVYNNRFIRRVYIGRNKAQATKKFKDALSKGEI